MKLETGEIYEVSWPDSSRRLVSVLGPVEYFDVAMGMPSDVDVRLLAHVNVLASAIINPSFKDIHVTSIKSFLFWELREDYSAVKVSQKDLPLYVSWPWKSLDFDRLLKG